MEIDSLNSRSRSSETAFLELYKKLSNCPDPVPLLESALEFHSELQTLTSIKSERDALLSQMNEYDLLKQENVKLSKKVYGLETFQDEFLKEKIQLKESELKSDFELKCNVYKENEYVLNRQIQHLKSEISKLENASNSIQESVFIQNQLKGFFHFI